MLLNSTGFYKTSYINSSLFVALKGWLPDNSMYKRIPQAQISVKCNDALPVSICSGEMQYIYEKPVFSSNLGKI